jgi:hypothetical protein
MSANEDVGKKSGFYIILLKIAGGIGALGVIAAAIINVYSYTAKVTDPEVFKTILAGLNLITLIIYCFLSSTIPRLELNKEPESERNYCNLLGIKFKAEPNVSDELVVVKRETDLAKENTVRVNLLVKQLHANILGYAMSLIIVYLIYLFDNKVLFDEVLFEGRNLHRIVHVYLNIVTGFFNLLSALFLYLGFKVLYDKTISDDGKNTLLPYRYKPAILWGAFLVIYTIFSFIIVTASLYKPTPPTLDPIAKIKATIDSYQKDVNKPESDLLDEIKRLSAPASTSTPTTNNDQVYNVKNAIAAYEKGHERTASNAINQIREIITLYEGESIKTEKDLGDIWLKIFQLIIGIVNGLAMALLFGRYVSMEHSAFIMKEGKLYKGGKYGELIHLCTIYILPIYVLAQPLFGSFDIDVFGNAQTFANGVFLVCWIGKIVFLYLTYEFMKRRLMHFYLHSVITSHGTPKELINCFRSCKKITCAFGIM